LSTAIIQVRRVTKIYGMGESEVQALRRARENVALVTEIVSKPMRQPGTG
jgi:hypothetical protein